MKKLHLENVARMFDKLTLIVILAFRRLVHRGVARVCVGRLRAVRWVSVHDLAEISVEVWQQLVGYLLRIGFTCTLQVGLVAHAAGVCADAVRFLTRSRNIAARINPRQSSLHRFITPKIPDGIWRFSIPWEGIGEG